jgi:hypothetical protein
MIFGGWLDFLSASNRGPSLWIKFMLNGKGSAKIRKELIMKFNNLTKVFSLLALTVAGTSAFAGNTLSGTYAAAAIGGNDKCSLVGFKYQIIAEDSQISMQLKNSLLSYG